MSNRGTASEDVAARILDIARQSGLSVNRLAILSGIPRPTLDRNLKVTPRFLSLGQIEDIADVLQVATDDLLLPKVMVA